MGRIPSTTKVKCLEENWNSGLYFLTEEEKAEMRKIIKSAKPPENGYALSQQAMVDHWIASHP